MTVCVAVICGGNTVIGMSDRMLTAGDVQFAPQQSKIRGVTNSIVAMMSGDIALANEILSVVNSEVVARIRREPNNWWGVGEVADLWRLAYQARRALEAEALFLSPLSLSSETFVSRQRDLAPGLVDKLANELINFELPAIEIIFAGIDLAGPHLYVASGASVRCVDAIGFAAVGSGGYHARSQLMFSGHTASSPINKSIYQTYAAKKRAEVAPGVGGETDTIIVWDLGGSSPVREDIIASVHAAFDEAITESARIAGVAEEKVDGAIKEILEKQRQPTQDVPKAADGATPAADADVGKRSGENASRSG